MKLTLEEVVALTEGELIPTATGASVENLENGITGLGSLDEAGSSDVSFLGNEKYYQDFLQTSAGVVLIPPGLPKTPSNSVLIEVANPSQAFGLMVKYFIKKSHQFKPGIHPGAHVAEDADFDPTQVCIKAGAVIESGASIGNGTEIGAGSVIGEGVQIGEDCTLYANVTIRERCILGNRVMLDSGCVIGSDGYGYELVDGKHEKVDQVGIVLLEDDVEVGANTTVDRARFGKTVIGEGTKVDNLVQIGHNVTIGKHCLVVAQSGIAGSSKVGNYVTFAAQSGCSGHVKICDKVVLTARAVVMKDITEAATYMGMPARPIREEMKKMASLSRLPKLVAEVKELRRRLDEKD